MFKQIYKYKWISLLLPFLLLTPATYAAEEDMEEVIVTGSYIKRSKGDSPSPLSVMTKADLDEIGATDMKDVIRNLTFNSGSIGVAADALHGLLLQRQKTVIAPIFGQCFFNVFHHCQ